MPQEPAIGRAVPRRDGPAKVTGRARYIDDLTLPGMLHVVTVRSPVPRGIIRSIDFGGGVPWDEITVVTAADIPGRNVVALLLAHPDKQLLEEARRLVRFDIEPLPAVFTLEEALAADTVVWGDDNLFKS